MKITEILKQNKPSLSFEVFPPKTTTAFESVMAATESIAQLNPSFMSVTYGAGGGTSRYTVQIAKSIMQNYGVSSIAHLTCVSSTRQTVRDMIAQINDAGIENVMALRGDIPAGMPSGDWDYHHAIDLVREIRQGDADLCIGGACYPEVHPESKSREDDVLHLCEKVDAGCDFLTTQMFFDNALFYNFLEQTSKAGIRVPILPGIMPITNVKQLDRAVNLSGSFIPKRLIDIAERYGNDADSMHRAGVEYATEQIIDLYSNGIGGVHVYSMNKPEVAASIKKNLSHILNE